jgi:hypothetical protein
MEASWGEMVRWRELCDVPAPMGEQKAEPSGQRTGLLQKVLAGVADMVGEEA